MEKAAGKTQADRKLGLPSKIVHPGFDTPMQNALVFSICTKSGLNAERPQEQLPISLPAPSNSPDSGPVSSFARRDDLDNGRKEQTNTLKASRGRAATRSPSRPAEGESHDARVDVWVAAGGGRVRG